MGKTIILKDLPDYIIRRLLPEDIKDKEIAYANIKTVLLVPAENGSALVVFDVKSEWNFIDELGIDELFRRMSGHI
jgi:hypothetical protein